MGMFSSRDLASHFRPAPKRRAARGTGERSKRKVAKLSVMRQWTIVDGVLSFTVPLYTRNPLNSLRSGFATSADRRRQHEAMSLFMPSRETMPALPVRVEMTRFYRMKPTDTDNLAACLKVVRDSIAKRYGIDDASPLYEWVPRQEKAKENGVRIEIGPRGGP